MTEPTLKDTLRTDLHNAMRSQDKVKSGTIRMTLSAITSAEVAGAPASSLSDDEVLKVITKEAKKRKEAAAAYTEAGRTELASQEEAELAVLEAYLPAQLGDDELADIVCRAVAETGATGMPQMGQVMKRAQELTGGRADGARLAALVKEALSS